MLVAYATQSGVICYSRLVKVKTEYLHMHSEMTTNMQIIMWIEGKFQKESLFLLNLDDQPRNGELRGLLQRRGNVVGGEERRGAKGTERPEEWNGETWKPHGHWLLGNKPWFLGAGRAREEQSSPIWRNSRSQAEVWPSSQRPPGKLRWDQSCGFGPSPCSMEKNMWEETGERNRFGGIL